MNGVKIFFVAVTTEVQRQDYRPESKKHRVKGKKSFLFRMVASVGFYFLWAGLHCYISGATDADSSSERQVPNHSTSIQNRFKKYGLISLHLSSLSSAGFLLLLAARKIFPHLLNVQ